MLAIALSLVVAGRGSLQAAGLGDREAGVSPAKSFPWGNALNLREKRRPGHVRWASPGPALRLPDQGWSYFLYLPVCITTRYHLIRLVKIQKLSSNPSRAFYPMIPLPFNSWGTVGAQW